MQMRQAFEAFLIGKGYRQTTPGGHPSTVRDYISRIDRVCQWENCTWQELAQRIDGVVARYDVGGDREELGMKSHRSVINALKRFREMLRENG